MSEGDFYEISDAIFDQIEAWVENTGLDIDVEYGDGVVILNCEINDTRIVLSRQPSTREIWVAARSGGYHFAQSDKGWYCKTGESLPQLMARVLEEQSGIKPTPLLVLS